MPARYEMKVDSLGSDHVLLTWRYKGVPIQRDIPPLSMTAAQWNGIKDHFGQSTEVGRLHGVASDPKNRAYYIRRAVELLGDRKSALHAMAMLKMAELMED